MVTAPSSTYLIPVGQQDDARLNALGAIYNRPSLELVGDLPEGGSFLDIGCGNGTLTRLFAERYPKTTFVGADISAEQIEVASSTPSAVSWEVCDVYHLDRLKEKYPKLFDVVFCRFILSHVRDVPAALDQMYAMVKPGGSLFIIELGEEHHLEHHPETIKAITAWEKMVELQFQLQGSHKDTVQRVARHAETKIETRSVQVINQDFPIKDREKKLLFSLGMEAGIAKLQQMGQSEIIQRWGYTDADAWRKDMDVFLKSDQFVTMRHHRWLHIQTRTESEIAALAADLSKDWNVIDSNLVPDSGSNGIVINSQTKSEMAAKDNS